MMLGVRQHHRTTTSLVRLPQKPFAPVCCRSSNEMPSSSDGSMETVDAENQIPLDAAHGAVAGRRLPAYGNCYPRSPRCACHSRAPGRTRRGGRSQESFSLHLKRNTWVRHARRAMAGSIARNKIVDAHQRRGRRRKFQLVASSRHCGGRCLRRQSRTGTRNRRAPKTRARSCMPCRSRYSRRRLLRNCR